MADRDQFLKVMDADGGAALRGSYPNHLDIRRIGPYPLAREVAFPDGSSGELVAEFDDINIATLTVTEIKVDVAAGRFTMTLAPFYLAGRYDIYGIEQPVIELDTGGLAMPMAMLAMQGGAPAVDDAVSVTEKQFDQLQQADSQRARLSQTPQGRALVAKYQKFNDDYNTVFQNNAALRQQWAAGGATKAMADHTATAISGDAIINPDSQTFGTTGKTYNINSGQQSIYLMVACSRAGLTEASDAVTYFSSQVATTTGNSKSQSAPMTPTQVFSTVNAQTVPAPGAAFAAIPAANLAALHAAVAHVGAGTHDESHLQTIRDHGHEIGDDEIPHIQAIYAEAKRVNAPGKRVDLFSGIFSEKAPETIYTFNLIAQPDGHLSIRLYSSTLPSPEPEMDSDKWAGPAGVAARKTLEEAHFIRGLMHDAVETAIKRRVEDIVGRMTAAG